MQLSCFFKPLIFFLILIFLKLCFLNEFTATLDIDIRDVKKMFAEKASAIVFPEAVINRPDVHVDIIFPSVDLLRCPLYFFFTTNTLSNEKRSVL